MKKIRALESFLNEYFNKDILQLPLYRAGRNALQFEISKPGTSMGNPESLEEALHRAVTLFDELFSEEDEMFVAADVYTAANFNFMKKRTLSTYQLFVENREVLDRLRHEMRTEPLSENGQQMVTHRFLQTGNKKEIRYRTIFETKCCENVRMPITSLKKVPNSKYDVFFINRTRPLIFHLCDEHSCDIIAADKEELRSLYEKYSNWIKEEKRREMDSLFTKMSS